MKKFINLIRVKHYLKNGLIFLPIFFSQKPLNSMMLLNAFLGFLAFSLISSVVYIINDVKDLEKDRLHPRKKHRPIASGDVSVKLALIIAVLFLGISLLFAILIERPISILFLIIYLLLNIAYSLGLKNIPLVDIAILSSGFVLRLIYGASISNINISGWLYLTVIAGSLYLGLGKRRNEIGQTKDSQSVRQVLKYYSYDFLDKNMYVSMALTIAFYSIWSVQNSNPLMIWSVPMIIFIFMKYSMNIESELEGDPVEVILHDQFLNALVLIYVIYMTLVLYI